MDLTADLTCAASPTEVFDWIDDLGRYPQWMGLVHRATQINDIDGVPAWDVELRARIGPFARSKRLTMTRAVCEHPQQVVFERHENDGRKHSMWRLAANVETVADGTRMVMHLHYGGGMWTGGIVERVLEDEIERSRVRLIDLVAGSTR